MVVYGYLVFGDSVLPIEKKQTLIGRAPTCHLVFSHPSISKEHAFVIFTDDGQVFLKDLEALNRSYINGQPVAKGSQVALMSNDQIIFGKDPNTYVFVLENPSMILSNYQQRRNSRDNFLPVSDLAVNLADSKTFTSPINHLGAYGTPSRKFNSTQKSNTASENPSRSEIKPPIRMQYDQNPSYYKTQYKESHELVIPERDLVDLHDKILQRDEIIISKETQLDQYRAHIAELQEEIGKLNAKLGAVELYASEVQRKNDLVAREMTEKNTRINELETSDWIKKAQDLQIELKHARHIILTKDEENSTLKQQLNDLLRDESKGSAVYYPHILEQQSKELNILKRQLEEYESRSNVCKRKWNDLVRENVHLEERVKGLNFQIARQAETYKNTVLDNDTRVADLHARIARLINSDIQSREREAAEILLGEMNLVTDERTKVAIDNEQLHMQIQCFIEEVRSLSDELQLLGRHFTIPADRVDTEIQIPDVVRMKNKIEELEDVIAEMKNAEGVNVIVELRELVTDLEKKIGQQSRSLDDLKNKLLDISNSDKGNPEAQNMLDFFSRLLESRDYQVANLEKTIGAFAVKPREDHYKMDIKVLEEKIRDYAEQVESMRLNAEKYNRQLQSGGFMHAHE